MPESVNFDEWVPIGDAARTAGCSVQWLSHLAATGRVATMTTPLGRLYRKEDCARVAVRSTAEVRHG